MKTKILDKTADLTAFAKKCEKKLELRYPIEYLERSMVRAFYNKYGAMVGGYILNFEGPFRVIESLPDQVKKDSPWVDQRILKDAYEVTGLWLDRKVVDKKMIFLFWATMYKDLVLTKKKYFVYAYDLDKTYLKEIYSIVNPEVIYSGLTTIQTGMKYECEESVEIASVNYIRFGILYGWEYFLKKLLFSRRAKSSKLKGMSLIKYGTNLNLFKLKAPAPQKAPIK